MKRDVFSIVWSEIAQVQGTMNNYRPNGTFVVVVLLVTLCPILASADKVYKWTDVQGNVSYQDHPPPAEAAKSEAKEINPEENTTKFEPPARIPAGAGPPSTTPPTASTPAQARTPGPVPITKRLDEEMLRKLLIGAGAGTGAVTGTGAATGTGSDTGAGTATGSNAISGTGAGSVPPSPPTIQQIPTP
jgi:hypothetical protein